MDELPPEHNIDSFTFPLVHQGCNHINGSRIGTNQFVVDQTQSRNQARKSNNARANGGLPESREKAESIHEMGPEGEEDGS